MISRKAILIIALSGGQLLSVSAMADVDVRPASGGPTVRLPAAHPRAVAASLPAGIDPWVQAHVTAGDVAPPSEPLFETMAAEMIERYAGTLEEIDDGAALLRLQDIAAGATLRDYARPEGFETAVRFSETIFDAAEATPAEVEASPRADKVADLMGFLGTPDGMRMLSTMSGDQIGAMAALVSAMQGEASDEALARDAAPLSGVPELSASALESVDINDLLSKPGRDGPSVRDVGDGGNLLLDGWIADFDPARGVMISNPAIAASEMVVEEGMVIGPFGLVEAIEEMNGILVVRLESGDEIKSLETVDLAPLVPELTEVAESEAAGEIILTDLPEMPRAMETEVSDLAPTTSLRPQSRPKIESVADLAQDEAVAEATPVAEVVENPAKTASLSAIRPRPRPTSISATAVKAESSPEIETKTQTSIIGPRPRLSSTLATAEAAEADGAREFVLASTRPRPRPDWMSNPSAENGRNISAASPAPRDQ